VAAVDLNCDLGEGYPFDEELLALVTSANVACGGHYGDAATMRAACSRALRHGVTIGAHPSYEDREGFGRRPRDVDAGLLERQVSEQIAALRAEAAIVGAEVRYVKPHGALYNRIAVDLAQAEAVVRAAASAGLPLLGQAGTAAEAAARRAGLPFVAEAFADRGYRADGTLADRAEPGGLITDADAVAARVLRMSTDGEVAAVDGTRVTLTVESVCLHGDTPGAVDLAVAVRRTLGAAGVAVRPFREP
jgi:UPF0271 protein